MSKSSISSVVSVEGAIDCVSVIEGTDGDDCTVAVRNGESNGKNNGKNNGKSNDKSNGSSPLDCADGIEGGVARSLSAGDYLVHPAHGVGCVRGVEAEEIAGVRMDMIAISFVQERMVVRVPTQEYASCGLRSLASPDVMEIVYKALRTKGRTRKTMWGRRAQEYDNKIRSGNPLHLAQVVRELYRGEEQPCPSYSERQYYQLALERLSREVAAIESIKEKVAVERLETILAEAA